MILWGEYKNDWRSVVVVVFAGRHPEWTKRRNLHFKDILQDINSIRSHRRTKTGGTKKGTALIWPGLDGVCPDGWTVGWLVGWLAGW